MEHGKLLISGWVEFVPLLAVVSALGTGGAALVARITRNTHICGGWMGLS